MSNILTATSIEQPDRSFPGEKVWGTIAGVTLFYVPERYIRWVAGMAIDGDGLGSSHGDPDYQPETSYKIGGRSLNADNDSYIVIPGSFNDMFGSHFLGSWSEVYNMHTRRYTRALAGDVGPRHKIGEASIACAGAVGVPNSPTTGGESRRVVHYVLYLAESEAFCMPMSQGHVG